MERDRLLEKISIDPRVCFGKPCIRGHRIWVSLVLDLLASGLSIEEVLEEYPQLSRDFWKNTRNSRAKIFSRA